ncbi:hypothetical protein QFC22_000082 [Naganishia vaughanmartiniae]|uniref:Uncharacterized protein n=1 Tax=Naganishia vaughanmartiniae TaxID=1424756 RepID=A0ACC2XMQ9_9TREE|nr:hypothetical protein QFC22_000082 [Naganishia vaughanmartiniae]
MDASLQMEYLQGLLRLALQRSTSVAAQPVEDGRSAKPDVPNNNRSGNVNPSSAVPISSPPLRVADTNTGMYSNEERILSRFETMLDNKLEAFEEGVIAPLANDIRHIGRQCTRIEANMLLNPEIAKQALNGTTVPSERPSMPGSYLRPSRSPNSSIASLSENPSQRLTMESKTQPSSKTMKMVSDLFAQIGKDGFSSSEEVYTISLGGGNKVSLADRDRPLTTAAAVNHKPLGETNDNTSDWSDSVFGDGREVKPARSKSARPFLQSGNKGSKYVMPEERKIGETLVVVDDVNGVAVRSLDPRPCHKYVVRSIHTCRFKWLIVFAIGVL